MGSSSTSRLGSHRVEFVWAWKLEGRWWGISTRKGGLDFTIFTSNREKSNSLRTHKDIKWIWEYTKVYSELIWILERIILFGSTRTTLAGNATHDLERHNITTPRRMCKIRHIHKNSHHLDQIGHITLILYFGGASFFFSSLAPGEISV